MINIYKNISIEDSVDTFASTLGNELIYESGHGTNLLLPCFNAGFYDNDLNNSPITSAVDLCYFLFESVSQCKIELSTYHNLFPDENGIINLDGNKFEYLHRFHEVPRNSKCFEIEGTCYRRNSFSYGSFKIDAQSMHVILVEESQISEEYGVNNSFKNSSFIKSFLLGQNTVQIAQIISEIG